jgi:hypothetical protein
MIFFSSSPSKKYQQEADALIVQATAVLKTIRLHDNNCGKGDCCVSEIIKSLGVDQTPRRTVVSSAPFRHGCDNNLNDLL